MTQPELFQARQRPRAGDDERMRLERGLIVAPTWLKADYLCTMLEWSDRKLRAVASTSDKVISGQRGYRHIAHATMAEVSHAVNWLRHQATEMNARAMRIERAYHRRDTGGE